MKVTAKNILRIASFNNGIALILILASGWHFLYSDSVDLGLHYALIRDLFSQLDGAVVASRHLGVMAVYPSGAHWIAVLLSLLTQSPLVSIVVVSTICIYIAYIVIALFLIEGPFVLTSVRLVGLMLITWFLATQQAAFGYHVIVNYFFPHMVGETLVLILLYVLTHEFFWSLRRRYQAVSLFGIAWLLGYIQPIASVQFGAGVILFICISTYIGARARSINWVAGVTNAIVLSAALILAVILHPALKVMKSNSNHEGYLEFGSVVSAGNYKLVLGFAILMSLVAVFGAMTNVLNRRRALILASATLGSATLLLMQMFVLQYLDMGSNYAVSKYIFFLATLTAITGVYAITGLILSRQTYGALQYSETLLVALLPPLFALLSVYVVYSNSPLPKKDIRPILDYIEFTQYFSRFSFPLDGPENIASLNDSFSPPINFLVSLGDLKLPFPIAVESMNYFRNFNGTPPKYAIVSRKHVDIERLTQCSVGIAPTSKYAVIERNCFIIAGLKITPDKKYQTAYDQSGLNYLTKGWSSSEPWGTWSISDKPRIEFIIENQPVGARFMLHVEYLPFIEGIKSQQIFSVVVDGIEYAQYVSDRKGKQEIKVEIEGGGQHVVEFWLEDLQSPVELNLSETDTRKIGIGITGLSLRTVH